MSPVDHPPPLPPSGPVPYPADLAFALLRDMLRVRRLEEKCAELYGAGKIRGFLHLYIGEEATGIGALHALTPEDNVVATYREHAHALVRGMDMGVLMAEMYGKREGCARGRGGSMHLFDRNTRLFGGNAIVGGGLPLAVGLALAERMQSSTRVTACFFGDGAVAEGAFHESMNLAALWRLPVLFCCENNLYAMGTALERYESRTDLCAKAAAYDMRVSSTDGMDVVAVHDAAKEAVAYVRGGAGPMLLELRTYRFRAHSMYDAELYREKAEVDAWKTCGPIHTFTARLKAEGKLTEDAFVALDADVEAEVARAVAFADGAGWEPVEALANDVYTATGDPR
ncbi:pyruvate dehydrogenase (acetyl-transferring) E1 component subunit alpha [Burkholderia territorii]|uniref:pyruvate dehydrogenase (acetyl-transferring) E1 component subunit alpha n=1 Tax=Burkholderia territorii TaxID=1503055 RepID=UPI0007580C65|nr:pyruvate dehydrogenase (acetyl-transferring) E1 component subunit alpha [Burkholderia territorii]KVQ59307.1 pyruvate dehydrogenase (acetyl-transferring) E1 component subunit alpha [Burkholderia territorii]KWA30966.1 pyruvate dehydrogenase (acetyl-transferring) E1 component subunit alpha [Burkholderia territorii]